MKKLITAALVCVIALTLFTACGSKSFDIEKAKEAVNAVTVTENGETFPLFNMSLEPTAEELKELYAIDVSGMESYVVVTPAMNVKSSMYALIIPKDGEKDNVKQMMSDAMASYQQRWDLYLPDQAELVSNRLETEVNGCLVYIISSDNDAVLKAIQDSQK